jgi:hypothetical protein
MLLKDLSLEDAERWLRGHGLDVEEIHEATAELGNKSLLAADEGSKQDRPSAQAYTSHSSELTSRTFVVDCLSDTTTLADLKRFLHGALPNLCSSFTPTFSSGANAFKVTMVKAVSVDAINSLDNNVLDGANIRVRAEPLAGAEAPSQARPKLHSS